MKATSHPNPAAEAERLLERFFRSGPKHMFIFECMKPLRETKAILDAPPAVIAEIVVRLVALIAASAKAREGTSLAACEALVRTLVPGLEAWDDEDSKWLASGAERVPPQLVPLLLRKRLQCSDAMFAEILRHACEVRKPAYLLACRDAIQAIGKQAIRRVESDGVGAESGKPLKRFATVLASVGRHEISALATWGKKNAAALREALAREKA